MRCLNKDGHDDHDVITIRILLRRNISKNSFFSIYSKMIFFGGNLLAVILTLEKNILFLTKKLRRRSRRCFVVEEGLFWDLEIFLDSDSLFERRCPFGVAFDERDSN